MVEDRELLERSRQAKVRRIAAAKRLLEAARDEHVNFDVDGPLTSMGVTCALRMVMEAFGRERTVLTVTVGDIC